MTVPNGTKPIVQILVGVYHGLVVLAVGALLSAMFETAERLSAMEASLDGLKERIVSVDRRIERFEDRMFPNHRLNRRE